MTGVMPITENTAPRPTEESMMPVAMLDSPEAGGVFRLLQRFQDFIRPLRPIARINRHGARA